MKWTAGMVVDALRDGYGIDARTGMLSEEWALLTEVPLRTPGIRGGTTAFSANQRTIDVLLVRQWISGPGFQRIAFEVKVSRADYRQETDHKREPAEKSAHRTAYAAPVGLIDPDTLPDGWGLVEVYPDVESYRDGTGHPLGGTALAKWRRKAKARVPECDLDYLVAAAMRRASRAEERIRVGADDAALVPRLRAEVERAGDALQRAVDARDRERTRARAARAELLALDGAQECADCEGKITWVRGGRNDSAWMHVDPTAERDCYTLRGEANRLRRQAATGARYLGGYPDPILPKAIRDREQAENAPQEGTT